MSNTGLTSDNVHLGTVYSSGSMPMSPGARLGPYQVQSRLGGGGMGEVWKAHDAKLQRTVAIKVLHDTADAASRILAEARAASALNHPHICTIHDVGDADGQSFIVMEHVEGKPLSELTPSDGLSQETVIRYATQIADGLAHAHQHGIVHRDLKSANVVITPDGRAKVLDFGVADKLPAAEAAQLTMTHTATAQPGLLVGTLAYCRQATAGRGGDVPERRVEPGRVALRNGERPVAVQGQIRNRGGREHLEGHRSSTTGPGVGQPAVHHRRCLARNQSGGTRTVRQCTRRWRHRVGRRAHADAEHAASIASSRRAAPDCGGRCRLVGGRPRRDLGLLGSRVGDPAGTATAVPRLVNPRQITSALGVEGRLTWSPDTHRIAYESEQSGNWDIWVAQVGGQQPVNLTADQTGLDARPSWSPDGTRMAFVSDRDGVGYYTMSALGGPAQKVMSANANSAVSPHRPQWSADGDELAGIVTGDDGNAAIEIVTLNSRESRRVVLPGSNFGFDPSWSPSGQLFALVESGG